MNKLDGFEKTFLGLFGVAWFIGVLFYVAVIAAIVVLVLHFV